MKRKRIVLQILVPYNNWHQVFMAPLLPHKTNCLVLPKLDKEGQRQSFMLNYNYQMNFQFTDFQFLIPYLLRSEGENHPTDDEIEQEDRINSQGFAVWRLTISKECCRGYYRPDKHYDHHKKSNCEVYWSRFSKKY